MSIISNGPHASSPSVPGVIAVNLSPAEVPDWARSDGWFEIFVIGKLRSAGIPVLGGIERGILTSYTDYSTGSVEFQWVDEKGGELKCLCVRAGLDRR